VEAGGIGRDHADFFGEFQNDENYRRRKKENQALR
jgi:hypothetical protein